MKSAVLCFTATLLMAGVALPSAFFPEEGTGITPEVEKILAVGRRQRGR